ncbi:MAG: hypothetical protein KC425_09375, partial [Anaerolineales bacterium]|nr:hypothetical protein [Anaerolineales bacterium]
MPMLPFIWLGARRTRKYPVAAPARLLDTAASRGLPVPAGGILLHEFYALLLREGVLLAENGRLHTPDPAWLHETLFD